MIILTLGPHIFTYGQHVIGRVWVCRTFRYVNLAMAFQNYIREIVNHPCLFPRRYGREGSSPFVKFWVCFFNKVIPGRSGPLRGGIAIPMLSECVSGLVFNNLCVFYELYVDIFVYITTQARLQLNVFDWFYSLVELFRIIPNIDFWTSYSYKRTYVVWNYSKV